MNERFVVHRIIDGHDRVMGSFEVRDGEIHYNNIIEQLNCDMFPPGPIGWMTKQRLGFLLYNTNKSVYITRG